MKAIIVVNSYADTKSELNQAERIKEELIILGVSTEIVKSYKLNVMIENGSFVFNYSDIDFCVYLDKDKHILEMLTRLNIKIYNNANAINICDDKLLTHIALSNNNIAMPKTIGGVLCYYPNAKYKKEIIDNVEKEMNYPIIVKECHGSFGKNVYFCEDINQLEIILDKIKLKPHIFQEFIKSSVGKDIRVIVIGGKCAGGMLRENKEDFRSNIEIGGEGKVIKLPADYIKMCEKVAKILNLDYCGIDILIGENNEPILCEVNSNAFFGTFEKITKINVAKLYAEYMIQNL